MLLRFGGLVSQGGLLTPGVLFIQICEFREGELLTQGWVVNPGVVCYSGAINPGVGC